MSPLRRSMLEYLAMRRRLGFKLVTSGIRLHSFLSFMERKGARRITTSLALSWAQTSRSSLTSTLAQRLSVVRGFARYMTAFDDRTEVPPLDLIPSRYQRRAPYIYNHHEERLILSTARSLQSVSGFGGLTLYTLIGLLSVTGMRPGEALSLELADVDLDNCLLTIRSGKYGKSRCVAIHRSSGNAIARYLRARRHVLAGRSEVRVFVTTAGNPYPQWRAIREFRLLTQELGLVGSLKRRRPRLMDFRHSYAVKALERLNRSGRDPTRSLTALSATLGHSSTEATYWYIEQHPEFQLQALKRLERRWKDPR